MASGLFKKKQNVLSSDLKDLSVSEAALSQSTFNVEKITDIQNRFRGGEALQVPGRIFIRDGVLWKVCRKGPKKRQFFLFNDVLVYGTIVSRGHYGNQHIMSLGNMSVSPDCHYMPQVDLEGGGDDKDSTSPSELKPENAFQINHSDKSFHVYSHSKADKGNWISNLNKQITRITKNRNPSDHMFQKAVWVPDAASKQCMICKQKFSAFVRKHHCRMCGRVVCSGCSPEKADIAKLSGAGPSGKLERICKHCKKPVILVTGGGVMGQERNDDVIEVNTEVSPATVQDGEESSETEDSDDSEKEDTPVPPPRKKKQHQLQSQDSQASPKKSPEQQKRKSIPPPRPSYTPATKSSPTKSTEAENSNGPKKKGEIDKASDETNEQESHIEETDSGPVVDEDDVSVPQPSPRSRNKSTPGKPTRPSSGSPSQTPSVVPEPCPPKSDSSPDKPVPKPRRTIMKKDTGGHEEPDDTNALVDLDHQLSDDSKGGVDVPDDCNLKESEGSPITVDNAAKVLVPLEESSLQEKAEEIEKCVQHKKLTQEEHEANTVQEDNQQKEDIQQEEIAVNHLQEDNNNQQDESSQAEIKEEVKSLASKRRKQKITKPSEHSTNTLGETPATTGTSSDSVDVPQVQDLPPMEKSFRSPSAHARQRRSKFNTSQQN